MHVATLDASTSVLCKQSKLLIVVAGQHHKCAVFIGCGLDHARRFPACVYVQIYICTYRSREESTCCVYSRRYIGEYNDASIDPSSTTPFRDNDLFRVLLASRSTESTRPTETPRFYVSRSMLHILKETYKMLYRVYAFGTTSRPRPTYITSYLHSFSSFPSNLFVCMWVCMCFFRGLRPCLTRLYSLDFFKILTTHNTECSKYRAFKFGLGIYAPKF